eukprot:scaffold5248_cov49-Phaeocystis_antarctica.AAC.2
MTPTAVSHEVGGPAPLRWPSGGIVAPNVKLKGKRGCVCSVDEEGSPNTAAMDTPGGCNSRNTLRQSRAHICSRSSGAASRTPARAIASRGEGRVAPPRATDEQLVGVGQGVCGLSSRKEGVRCAARCGPGAGGVWAGGSARAACTE